MKAADAVSPLVASSRPMIYARHGEMVRMRMNEAHLCARRLHLKMPKASLFLFVGLL